ncbi:hypothetical protein FQ085_06630 [Planococcus sp. ANT_H30]|uniref:hypothetical protein n=1 Tax=Planococcus sp. ANT_H30 TaxID=2597347 RepID=UPI0011EBBFAE|nr:hypothetical protein [Planococcus sp. ANT_H30]KAA0957722.1 hypothetical protein FQ085_06630 [Planococcus sp. ANT_H30]
MEYIIERNSSTRTDDKATDVQAAGLKEYVNYNVNEEGYKLHSIIPIPNGDHLVVLEPDNSIAYNIYYYDNDSGKMILEFETADMLEQLKLIKETDEVIIENSEGIFECKYVKSRINIFDSGSIISEVLDVFLTVNKVE